MNMLLRRNRSVLSGQAQGVRDASLHLDFARQKYAKGGSAGLNEVLPFADFGTDTRASTATYYDANGTLQTAAVDAPRFDHDPATGERLGILLEEQRTNLLTYSEQFDNAAWTKSLSTVTANTITSPDRTTTADKLVEDTTASDVHVAVQDVTFSAADYTFSAYLKSAERTFTRLVAFDGTSAFSCYVNLSTGEITGASGVSNSTSDDVGDGWYRVSISFSAAAGSGNIAIRTATGGTGSSDSYTGDGTSGIYLWGADLEPGSFPTSYIKTEASQVTRSADNLSITGTNFSDFYNQSEGTFVMDLDYLGATVATPVLFSAGTSFNDAVYISLSGSNLLLSVRSGGASYFGGASFALPSSQFRFAIALKDDDMAFVIDGGTISTDTSGTIPTPTNLSLTGASWAAGNYINTHIKSLTYYPRRLTNAKLQSLTTA